MVQLGRLDAVKRVDHAMRAVGIAVRSVPGIRLEVYGRGPEAEHLLELRRELGLEDVVSFPGFTEDPIEVLAGSAVSLMTSRREGFGLAVAESLAAGTPVVTYDVDYGPAELVADGVNGRVVSDGSVEGLADALVEVLADPETWSRMSQAGPAAAERLRPDVVAAQWLDLALDVAARVEVPSPTFLVEDLRVRRAGLEVEGVVIGPGTLRGHAGDRGRRGGVLRAAGGPVVGSIEVRRGDRERCPGGAGHPAVVGGGPVAEGSTALALAPPMARTCQWSGQGSRSRSHPPIPELVLVGWDDQQGVVRRVEGPDPIPVTGRLTSVRAAVGEDVTVLSEVPIARARLMGSRATTTGVEVQLMPGLVLTDGSELSVGAGAGDLRCPGGPVPDRGG